MDLYRRHEIERANVIIASIPPDLHLIAETAGQAGAQGRGAGADRRPAMASTHVS